MFFYKTGNWFEQLPVFLLEVEKKIISNADPY